MSLPLPQMIDHFRRQGFFCRGRNLYTIIKFALVEEMNRQRRKAGLPAIRKKDYAKEWLDILGEQELGSFIGWLPHALPWAAVLCRRPGGFKNLKLDLSEAYTIEEVDNLVSAALRHFNDVSFARRAGYHYASLGNCEGERIALFASSLIGVASSIAPGLALSHRFQNFMRPDFLPSQLSENEVVIRSHYLNPPRFFDHEFTVGVYLSMPVDAGNDGCRLLTTHAGTDVLQIIQDLNGLFGLNLQAEFRGPEFLINGRGHGEFVRILRLPDLQHIPASDPMEKAFAPRLNFHYERIDFQPPLLQVGGFRYAQDPNLAFLCTTDFRLPDDDSPLILRAGQFYNYQAEADISQDNNPRTTTTMPLLRGLVPTSLDYLSFGRGKPWQKLNPLRRYLDRRVRARLQREYEERLPRELENLRTALLENERLYEDARRKADIYRSYTRPSLVAMVESCRGTDPRDLEPVYQDMAILFSDIRRFTSLCEGLAAKEVVNLLNTYVDRMGPAFRQHGGECDKIIGDCLMLLFPDADQALLAALAMRDELAAFNEERRARGQDPLATGIGINFDSVAHGNMGSRDKLDYTVIGDGVNVASRVESLTKYYGCDLLVTDNLVRRLRGQYGLRPLDLITVKGKSEPDEIFEVIDGHSPARRRIVEANLPAYGEALASYRAGDWERSLLLFGELAASDASALDPVPAMYLRRLEKLIEDARGDPSRRISWRGVFEHVEK